MQEQEGRNAGPVHERPLRQSARPAAERATMRRTVCVVGAARLFTKHHTMGADEQDYTDTAAAARSISTVADLQQSSPGVSSE